MFETINVGTTRRSVLVSLAMNCAETLAIGIAALVTGSVALRAQTTANCADVAVEVFLLIGVLSSARPPDETHPLGYGRERFFWSLFAALGIFIGGSGLAFEDAIQSGLHPSPVDHFPIAYLALALTIALDLFAFWIALRPILKQAASLGISLRALRHRSTDSAAITVIVGGGCAVISAIIAALGLVVSQVTGSTIPDTIASAFIGLLLLVASVLLLQTTRDLLSGRGVPIPMLHQMVQIIAAQPGVIGVPDLFAVVVGSSSLIVDGDVIFADELSIPAVEQTIIRSTAALRERWPSIEYVYLTPVSKARPRRAVRSTSRSVGGK